MNPPHKKSHYDVVVLGGGAAGLMCAFTAARRGRRVLVVERANKPGKKILMSGGGRCNFTNYQVEPENFISANPHFCKSALRQYTQWDFIALVEDHGIAYEERNHGQLFCRHSARDILQMLLAECDQAGVDFRLATEIESIDVLITDKGEQRFHLQCSQGQKTPGSPALLQCLSVVVATGALSIPTLGGSGAGYDIARQFGLALTQRRPGLVPLMFTDSTQALCQQLAGVSVDAQVQCNGQRFQESLLFTHRGLSGPVILQTSNYWYPGDEISIDLLPELDASSWLRKMKTEAGRVNLQTVLHRKLPRALVARLQAMWWPDQADLHLAQWRDDKLGQTGEKLNNWRLKPSATEGYRTAEVTLGGVDTRGISSRTMEASAQPGLYFVGEVLDVSGHLGGYNFQWAWSSGHCAGSYA